MDQALRRPNTDPPRRAVAFSLTGLAGKVRLRSTTVPSRMVRSGLASNSISVISTMVVASDRDIESRAWPHRASNRVARIVAGLNTSAASPTAVHVRSKGCGIGPRGQLSLLCYLTRARRGEGRTDGWAGTHHSSKRRRKIARPRSQLIRGGHRAGREIGYCISRVTISRALRQMVHE